MPPDDEDEAARRGIRRWVKALRNDKTLDPILAAVELMPSFDEPYPQLRARSQIQSSRSFLIAQLQDKSFRDTVKALRKAARLLRKRGRMGLANKVAEIEKEDRRTSIDWSIATAINDFLPSVYTGLSGKKPTMTRRGEKSFVQFALAFVNSLESDIEYTEDAIIKAMQRTQDYRQHRQHRQRKPRKRKRLGQNR
jgi:hypothetical protein